MGRAASPPGKRPGPGSGPSVGAGPGWVADAVPEWGGPAQLSSHGHTGAQAQECQMA